MKSKDILKVLKRLTIKTTLFIVAIGALFLFVSIFLPPRFIINKSIIINRPVSEVYTRVSDIHSFSRWNPWTDTDSTIKIMYIGEGSARKFIYKGNILGEAEFSEIRSIKDALFEFSASTPDNKKQMINIIKLEGNNGNTKVTWQLEKEVSYPFGRYMTFFIDDLLGPDFEKGLEKLKTFCEENRFAETRPLKKKKIVSFSVFAKNP